ncbi:uncharacterized protein LOC144134902 [Amblyomma americanum]
MEVTVEDTEITPEELRTSDWITKVGKHVKERQDLTRGERRGGKDGDARLERGAESGEGKKIAAEANAAYKKLGQKNAERSIASYLPRLPANDYKIIIRPKNGLALSKVPTTRLSAAVRMAAQIPWVKGQDKDVLIHNDKQGTLIFSNPDMDTVWKVTKIKSIHIGDDEYEVTAYLAPHEDCGRGVVHGIDPKLTIEELTEAFGNPRNPPILGVRKMGKSSSAIVIFKHETVPRWVYCYDVPLKCVLYKKRYEVCYRCGELGHRSDVCVSAQVKCLGCGIIAPPEDHVCEPKCKLCGKGHLTADRKCKEAFRTPYTIKHRQWEAKLAMEVMEEDARKAKETEVGRSRFEKHQGRSRSQSGNQSESRGRSESFPRLPNLREAEMQKKAQPGTAGPSGGAVVNNPARPKSPSRKVGWASEASQDKRDEEIFQIKEENRLLKAQLAAMSKQIEELRIALKPNAAPAKQSQMPQNPVVRASEEQGAAQPPAKKRAKEVEKPIIDMDTEKVIDIKIEQLEAKFEAKSRQDNEWRKAFEERMLGMFQTFSEQLHQRDNSVAEQIHQRDNNLTEQIKEKFAKRDRAYDHLTQQVQENQMNQLIGNHGSQIQ